jgi:hypothetical protein
MAKKSGAAARREDKKPKPWKASDTFEQKIARIYELLTDSGAEVIWNDHIPDPDNPAQPRQIDVTIRRAGVLTLVECRLHKRRQNVQWIEELIGRRISLCAQEVIAVSDAGFTPNAIAKAKKHGVILRDLQLLTDQEIASWGQRVDLTLFFYQYSDLEVSLLFGRESILKIEPEGVKSELRCHPCVQSLFNAAAQKLGDLNLVGDEQPGRTVEFRLKLQFEEFRLCGAPVLEVAFTGKACLIALKAAPRVVCAYREPDKDSGEREAMIQDFSSHGKISITHSRSRISTFFDLSELEIPPFCQFRFVKQDAGQEMDHEAIEFQLGQKFEKLKVTGKGLKVNLCST